MHRIIRLYSPSDVVHRVDREGEKKQSNTVTLRTIFQFYSLADADDRVDRE